MVSSWHLQIGCMAMGSSEYLTYWLVPLILYQCFVLAKATKMVLISAGGRSISTIGEDLSRSNCIRIWR